MVLFHPSSLATQPSWSLCIPMTLPRRNKDRLGSCGVRRVRGLKWVELRQEQPFKKSRPRRSALKRGLAYEKKVTRELKRQVHDGRLEGELFIGQWIQFSDQYGISWAQPDAYILMENRILLLEAKLTQADSAVPQLLSLYLPLLRSIYELPILCIQVCRNLRYVPRKLVESPQEVLQNPGPGVFVWHFI